VLGGRERVAAQLQLREHDEVGADRPRLRDGFAGAADVLVDGSEKAVELGERDAHRAHITTRGAGQSRTVAR
jgi:hypothetical protein